MAAASKSAAAQPLGVSLGPEETILVAATNIDVDSNIDFVVVGPAEGVEVVIVSGTAKTGTPSVVFTLQRKDLASGTYIDLVSTAAMTNNGNDWLLVSHHAAAVTNHSVGRLVSEQMRLKIDYTGTPVTDVLNNVTVTALAI